jgi:hypothetical protein
MSVGFTPNEANPLRLEILVKDLEQLMGDQVAGAATKLDVHAGELVEIDGRRYDLVPDRQGGLMLQPAIGVTVAKLDRRHGTRPAPQAEIADQLDLPPGERVAAAARRVPGERLALAQARLSRGGRALHDRETARCAAADEMLPRQRLADASRLG